MQDIMVLCEEVRGDDLAAFRSEVRSCGLPSGTAVAAVPLEDAVAAPSASGLLAIMDADGGSDGDRGEDCAAHAPQELALDFDHNAMMSALRWATGYSELAVLEGLLTSLPKSILHEQLQLHASRVIVPVKPNSERIVCNPARLACREAVARKFVEFARSRGLALDGKMP